jgi:sialate O-acetylesterase
MIRKMLPIALLLWLSLDAGGAVVPHALFSEGAVLQADAPVTVRGQAGAGETLSVGIAGRRVVTKAGADGRWRAELAPAPAGGPHVLVITAESGGVSVPDIWFGDVWLAGGQSNMMWLLGRMTGAVEEIRRSGDGRLRFFTMPEEAADAPREDVAGKWEVSSAAASARFSAVAYYFGTTLRGHTGRPMGILQNRRGRHAGLRVEKPGGAAFRPSRREHWKLYDEALAGYPAKMEAWRARTDAGTGSRPPSPPPPERCKPSGYYNAIIAPLTGFPVRGVIWYQGEANSRSAGFYEDEFSDLITDWRRLWERGDLPFLFVQLAAYGGPPHVDHN